MKSLLDLAIAAQPPRPPATPPAPRVRPADGWSAALVEKPPHGSTTQLAAHLWLDAGAWTELGDGTSDTDGGESEVPTYAVREGAVLEIVCGEVRARGHVAVALVAGRSVRLEGDDAKRLFSAGGDTVRIRRRRTSP